MTRVTTTILIFMILMNGTVGVMASSGLTDELGVALAPGVSETMDNAVSHARDGFSPTGGLGQTLFALFMSGVNFMRVFVEAVWAAPQMFINLGFPGWFVIPIFAPAYVISMLELMYVATGRDMV